MHAVHRIGAVLLVAVLVAACGSTERSPAPSLASPSGIATPPPASAATPTSRPSPAATPGDPMLGAVVKTVSDRLRVRSQPRVSDDSKKLEPLLPLGTELDVVGGPVTASGYTWYEVAPVTFALNGGADRGWVAMGDHDGTPWIAVAEPPITGLELAKSDVKRLAADPKDAKAAAASVTAFGLDMYRRLLADPDLSKANMVFSPTSIALALGMARAGAKGTTASEMDDVLHTDGWAELGPGLNALDQAIVSRDGTYKDDEGKTHSLALRIANSTFAQRGWSMERAFLDAIAAAFGAGVQLVDYQADPEAARKTINAWVSRQTERRIPELLLAARRHRRDPPLPRQRDVPQGQLGPGVRQGGHAPRRRSSDSTARRVDVPTMRLRGEQEVPYVRGDGWRATELRYRGRDGTYPLAMDLIMPTDLASFEADLTPKQLAAITTALTKERVRLNEEITGGTGRTTAAHTRTACSCACPSSAIETRATLGDTLAALGMPTAFDAGSADFTGIHVPDAARARSTSRTSSTRRTSTSTRPAPRPRPPPRSGWTPAGAPGRSRPRTVTFRLDHPFLFVLRDLETGAILFMGRVVDPSIQR